MWGKTHFTRIKSMTDITRASISDLAELHPLVEKYREFYKQSESPNTAKFLTERLTNDEAVVFIARTDGNPVGFTMIYPTFSTVSLSAVWLLNDLYVVETSRGQGIAHLLMDAAEAAAREAGATRIFLRTANDNTAAQALYESRGWKQDEVFRRYDLIF
jgi:ribosomal protein S18 acetylase RimI-like enzyme